MLKDMFDGETLRSYKLHNVGKQGKYNVVILTFET